MPPLTQDRVENENMSVRDVSIAAATPPANETPAETIARSRRLAPPIEPTVTAGALEEPTTAPSVPTPRLGSVPDRIASTARAVAQESEQRFITPQTEEAARLRELQDEQAALGGAGSLSDLFQTQREELGIPENIREMRDINLQLADMQTASDLTQTRIANAPGQVAAQAGREVTQEQREAAVRQAGLAARAAVLQGNIETARQSALDAVNIEYQDRQLRRQNLIDQINAVQPTVDEQTAQLLEQEKRRYEEELAETEELKNTIANAMVSGASQQEIAQLTSDAVDDQTKLQLARTITARGATEERELEMQQTQASIDSTRASEAAAWALANERQVGTLISRAEGGDESAIAELGYDPRTTSADVVVPDEFQSTVDQAAALAGAEDQRETTKTIIGKALSNGNYTQAYSQIANNVEESLTGTVKSRFADARTDIGVMTSMRDAINEYVAAGGDTGLLKGTAEDVAERFGVLANSKDPEFASLGARLQREFQTYRNIMTGAAFTPEESAEYEAVNPTENKSLDLNLAIIDGAIDQLEDRVVNTIETRVSGASKIYEKAITGGADTVESSWDEVQNMAIGERFNIGGQLYEKAGEDNYIEVN